MSGDAPRAARTAARAARRAEAEDLVRLLRQIDRQPELGHRLLHALQRLLTEQDQDACVELARRFSRQPVRSRAAAVRWVRRLHVLLLATRRRH